MFRRRSSHKPSEAFLNAFKDRYGNASQTEQGASPAVTPFLLGPPPPGAVSNALIDSTSDHNLDGDEHKLDSSQFDPGSYQKHHFMDHHLFDLDPNGLDLTFGGGWAPSPRASTSMSGGTPNATALASASALDTPTSITYAEPGTGPQFHTPNSLGGHPAFNTFGMLQHMGPIHSHYQPVHHFMPNAQTFDPQESMLQHHHHHHQHQQQQQQQQQQPHHHQQHQQQSHIMASSTAFSIPRSFGLPQAHPEHAARKATKAEREQEQFRFRVKLMAPTAMVSHEEDHPITYLNKRQPYTITITDTQPSLATQHIQYRTSVRVSFDDEPQRAKPSSSWQLFREGRGQSEADERGSPELRAIEWVSPEHGSAATSRASVQKPHKEFFDGFSVYWTPGSHASGMPEASLQLRCNFLSTDFSHSKGVKGIPVRLCCKTEIVTPHLAPESEICYCKVKTFRDHGAERKLNNDRTHVEKNIDKLARELEQSNASSELNSGGKRHRSDSILSKSHPNKKHRTNSVSSMSPDADDTEGQLEEKIQILKTKMASGRDHSLLYLKGDDGDDPDMHPPDLLDDTAVATVQPPPLQHFSSSSTHKSINSPVPSSQSTSKDWQHDSTMARGYLPTPAPGASRNPSASEIIQYSSLSTATEPPEQSTPQHLASPLQGPSRIKKQRGSAGSSVQEWIEVVDTDQTYKPFPPPEDAAIACFYVRLTVSGMSLGDDYLRAIYLKRRDCQTFIDAVSYKCGINPNTVTEILRSQPSGQHIKVEDDTIVYLKEGQDMSVDFELLDPDTTPVTNDNDTTKRYRLNLMY